MSITIPDIDPEADTLTAALTYAAAGLYVGPARRGSKHPGSVLGSAWQRLTSTDPQVITSWFAGSDHGIFAHAGRSGLLVADVDAPEKLHPLIRRAVDETSPPYQTTRRGEDVRGHYLFEMPEGRVLGNSTGGLGTGWGEVRGHNGVIIVAPSVHEEDDGLYQWQRTGTVPALPGYVAAELPDAMPTEATATNAQVRAFLEAHTRADRPELVGIHATGFQKRVAVGESRHQSMCGPLAGAMREAAAGLVDARTAADTLEAVFTDAVMQAPTSGKQGKARDRASARNEWRGLLAWAVPQAKVTDPAVTRARIAEKVPSREQEAVWLHELAGASCEAPAEAATNVASTAGEPEGTHVPSAEDEDPTRVGSEDEPPAPPPLDVITAAEVTLRRVRYLWDRRIPVGAPTLMPGEEGIGKTTVGIRLMADVTRGCLPGEFRGTPRDVIVMAAEDGVEDVFVPRLQEAGADLTRVHIIRARVSLDGDRHGVIVPRDLDVIAGLVRRHDAPLVWIDSLVTTLPDELKSISYKDTAKVLRRLGEWAAAEQVAVVAPWHLNKGKGSDTGARIMDSRAFRTAVRSMLLVVADPDAPEGATRGIVALDKANAGSLDVPGLRYELRSSTYTIDELDEATGEVREVIASCGVADWIGEVDGDGRQIARDALAPKIEKDGGPKQWLREYLDGEGEALRADVLTDAFKDGFSESAIKRAARSLAVVSRDETGQAEDGRPYRRSVWSLPSRVTQSGHLHDTHPTGPTDPTGETPTGLTNYYWPDLSQSGQSGQSVVCRRTDPTEDEGDPTEEPAPTCGHPVCDDPPRPDKRMCARHYTHEPAGVNR